MKDYLYAILPVQLILIIALELMVFDLNTFTVVSVTVLALLVFGYQLWLVNHALNHDTKNPKWLWVLFLLGMPLLGIPIYWFLARRVKN